MRAHCASSPPTPPPEPPADHETGPPSEGEATGEERPHGSSGSGAEGRLRAHRTNRIPFCTSSARITFLSSGGKPPTSPSSRLEAGRETDLSGQHRAGAAAPASKPCPQRKITRRRPPAPEPFKGRGAGHGEPGTGRCSPGTRPGRCVRLQTELQKQAGEVRPNQKSSQAPPPPRSGHVGRSGL